MIWIVVGLTVIVLGLISILLVMGSEFTDEI